MDNSNPKNKPNMPKFNMNWLYIFVIIALGVVLITGGGGFFPSNAAIDKDYTTFKQYVAKGYATKVIVNKNDNTLRMYVSPNHIRDIFKKGTKDVGTAPYVTVEIGSVDKVCLLFTADVADDKARVYLFLSHYSLAY